MARQQVEARETVVAIGAEQRVVASLADDPASDDAVSSGAEKVVLATKIDITDNGAAVDHDVVAGIQREAAVDQPGVVPLLDTPVPSAKTMNP
ncbi:hypothetical protein SAMN05216376_104172 [Mameliella alba]|uniref:hypothetical protein n=1 Tax=Mameliella alba TaxID=561184 RepID=UPI00088536CD|nr:hypothetical protein [Mameliella alba]PTR38314.1 hypothetical protein LX94_02939 [Mameliella alba]GGF58223.1 hypothetical protein GCM10011319_19390 [Mameliella alba]SDC80715.1 hypothetical protein SAMN05216376_104172 [Mameliella alba]